jgi:hypothetical protein
MRKILIGAAIVAVFFGGTLLALDTFFSGGSLNRDKPALKELPPLPPVTRTSQVIAPVAVAMNAIRDKIDAAAPRNLAGKQDNPLSELLGKADIGYTMARGPIGVAARQPAMAITTTLNGSVRVTGQIANVAGGLTGQLGGLFGSQIGKQLGGLTKGVLDQRADIRGNVTVTSRPQLNPNWRIEPNLAGNVAIADGGLSVAGLKINIANEIKPLLDRTVNEQMNHLQARMRSDTTLETTARREWTKMCRSISLGAAAQGAPALWLEMRPTRAYAAQPRIVDGWVILTMGMQAETRIVPSETKPACPFPASLDIVPSIDQGKVAIAVPIDVPFTELNRVLEAQLKGKTFPEDPAAPLHVTVQKSSIAASGDRLLISLNVRGVERRSWFGLGADAVVHVWGRPALNRDEQILGLTDIELAVESEAAFGLLGAAAQAARPQLQAALAENAVVDLKPFAASARKSIQAAIGDFTKATDGVQPEAEVTSLRLVGIEFDSKTLRVVAEADGTARALVTKLP